MPNDPFLPLPAALAPEERAWGAEFLRGMRALFAAHGVSPAPLLALRVEDVLMSSVQVQRLERAALHAEDEDHAPKAWDAAGRARERLRKAMSDLEDACAKLGTRIDGNLPERAKPLLEAARGVAEASLRPKPKPEKKK